MDQSVSEIQQNESDPELLSTFNLNPLYCTGPHPYIPFRAAVGASRRTISWHTCRRQSTGSVKYALIGIIGVRDISHITTILQKYF